MRIKHLFILVTISLFFACKKSDTSSGATNYTFSITQSIPSIQVLDQVSFNVESDPLYCNITNISWSLNASPYTSSSNFVKKFQDPGNYNLSVTIDYYDNNNVKKTTTLNKTLVVADLPNNMVTLNKIEINAMLNAGTFYVSPKYFMKLKLLLTEKDESNTESIKYISPENSQNWGVVNMIYPISFNLSALNYKMKVFKTGNIYPNLNQTYHTEISIQSAKQYLGSQEPFGYYDYFYLDLNTYRSIKPSTIDISSGKGVQYKLYVTWN